MFDTIIAFYVFLKVMFLYSLVRTQVKFEPMREHYLLFGVLYTGAAAFLSYVFYISPQAAPNMRLWEMWLGKVFVIYTVYFWLLSKYDEGVIFWTLLPLGAVLVYVEAFVL